MHSDDFALKKTLFCFCDCCCRFFDNMTEYLDSLLTIQEKVAKRITEEVDEVLKQVDSRQTYTRT